MFRCPTCISVLVEPRARRCETCGQNLRRRPPLVLGDSSKVSSHQMPIDRFLNERAGVKQPEARPAKPPRTLSIVPAPEPAYASTAAAPPAAPPAPPVAPTVVAFPANPLDVPRVIPPRRSTPRITPRIRPEARTPEARTKPDDAAPKPPARSALEAMLETAMTVTPPKPATAQPADAPDAPDAESTEATASATVEASTDLAAPRPGTIAPASLPLEVHDDAFGAVAATSWPFVSDTGSIPSLKPRPPADAPAPVVATTPEPPEPAPEVETTPEPPEPAAVSPEPAAAIEVPAPIEATAPVPTVAAATVEVPEVGPEPAAGIGTEGDLEMTTLAIAGQPPRQYDPTVENALDELARAARREILSARAPAPPPSAIDAEAPAAEAPWLAPLRKAWEPPVEEARPPEGERSRWGFRRRSS